MSNLESGLVIKFNGDVRNSILIPGEGIKKNPLIILFSDDEVLVRKYLQDILKGRKLEMFWNYESEKSPDVILQLIRTYVLNLVFTRSNALYKNKLKFRKESPIQHKAVIMEIFKVLSPSAKKRYTNALNMYYHSVVNSSKKMPNINNAHLKYQMTDIGTLTKQIPVNVASEIRTSGRTRSLKNELLAQTWADPSKIIKREGINISSYKQRHNRKTRKNK